ncbi:uncharacterized protein EHS24_003820 [Apiotrichum porosum]|uniref:Ras-protein Rab-18 n=1 Tax=Apiotrichum porosum TaxID=105984 RepID=A0A427XDS6_9TREE|nr:uncharacterized protein EHS24_003820 [Apiotrichum porosum]RSH76887.1 hypothetical protein EHS24_003820 [Apiotrichum porosum]
MSDQQQYPTNLKLLLIGNSSVDDDFLSEEETTATIGVDFKVKSIELDGHRYKLSVWDTAGQERFRTLTSSYYRGAQGVVLVYDVSSRNSFDELIKWFREIDTYCSEDVVKIIVGNKVDKEFSRQVTSEEGQAFADRMGTLFVECSAKTNVHVTDAFQELVRRILATPSLWTRGPQPVRNPQSVIALGDDSASGYGGPPTYPTSNLDVDVGVDLDLEVWLPSQVTQRLALDGPDKLSGNVCVSRSPREHLACPNYPVPEGKCVVYDKIAPHGPEIQKICVQEPPNPFLPPSKTDTAGHPPRPHQNPDTNKVARCGAYGSWALSHKVGDRRRSIDRPGFVLCPPAAFNEG